jgi:LysR family transcriptional regulator, benzoate and cis,cis-muconate-responsive activator of ben and cat genes
MVAEPDLRLVRYFVVVAEELHYGRGAARLFISQPALSQQIRKLEADLGVLLFDRDRRSVQLTTAGAELLEPARQLLAAAQRLTVRAERLSRAEPGIPTLVLGYQVQLPDGALTRIVQAHRQTHPAVRVELRQYDFTDTSAGLIAGTSDAAVLSLPVVHDLHTEPLYSDHVVALLAGTSALASQDHVNVADLVATGLPWAKPPDADPVWRDFWTAAPQRAALGRAGREVRFQSPPNVDSYVLAVAAGELIGLTYAGFTRAYPLPGIATVPVQDTPAARFAAARRPDDTRTSVADLLTTVHHILNHPRPVGHQ